MQRSATAQASPNIAFIKYWGNIDHNLRLPVNSSLSMNLDGLYTRTTVTWDSRLDADILKLNGERAADDVTQRVRHHLDHIRQRLSLPASASVVSENNFPMGAGIASSASAFAALTVAAVGAAGEPLTEREISTLARLGSGSASRSVPDGFVEWFAAPTHEASYAESIAAAEHWNLIDVIAVVSKSHKAVGSTRGHQSAETSALQAARTAGAEERVDICRTALLQRDFDTFAEVVEQDSNLMHAVMMTSRPPLFYWEPASLTIMQLVRRLRVEEALPVCYTLDAGPNVHCVCVGDDVASRVESELKAVDGVLQTFVAKAGRGAFLIDN